MALGQYNAEQENDVETMWFSGTQTVPAYGVVCLVHDANPTDADPKLRLGRNVTQPNANNIGMFAGVIHPSSAGRTGPCFVDVIRPKMGRVALARTQATQVRGATLLKPLAGSWNLTIENSAISNTTITQIVARAAQTVDTSTVAAVASVIWMI